MTAFTVRVELHDGEPSDYETLHEEMEARGFSRTITSDKGITYHLPEAEYSIDGDLTIDEVLDRAKAAATATRKKFGILVTEATRQKWTGLDKVKP